MKFAPAALLLLVALALCVSGASALSLPSAWVGGLRAIESVQKTATHCYGKSGGFLRRSRSLYCVK